jgi:hypothetical protein
VESTLSRTQVSLVAAGYGVAALISVALVSWRYLQYSFATEADKQSAMWGFGDWMLEIFILGLFLIPTFFLLLAIAKSEPASILYSKILLAFSMTSPLSIALMFIPAIAQGWMPGILLMYRVLGSPMILVGIVLSRIMAKFPRAKRLSSYALAVELGTLVLMMGSMFSPVMLRGDTPR